jgi:hypothetical protein
MFVGGVWALGAELFFADIIFFKFVMDGALLTTLGAYPLSSDFIAPLLGISSDDGAWSSK